MNSDLIAQMRDIAQTLVELRAVPVETTELFPLPNRSIVSGQRSRELLRRCPKWISVVLMHDPLDMLYNSDRNDYVRHRNIAMAVKWHQLISSMYGGPRRANVADTKRYYESMYALHTMNATQSMQAVVSFRAATRRYIQDLVGGENRMYSLIEQLPMRSSYTQPISLFSAKADPEPMTVNVMLGYLRLAGSYDALPWSTDVDIAFRDFIANVPASGSKLPSEASAAPAKTLRLKKLDSSVAEPYILNAVYRDADPESFAYAAAQQRANIDRRALEAAARSFVLPEAEDDQQ